ncbi:hypothetical protein Rs2_00226 [Raphanus sativus]|nr:hypothetical protein Rs2_00226 [Raphanus sativus]
MAVSLSNDYGGRKKYVEWAGLDEPDEFYTNSVVKQYYKNHVKAFHHLLNFDKKSSSRLPTLLNVTSPICINTSFNLITYSSHSQAFNQAYHLPALSTEVPTINL